MRIIMNGTTITGSVSEVLATLTHLGIKASDTKPVTLPLVTEIAVTAPFEAVEAELAKLHAGESVTPEAVVAPKLTRDGVIQRAIDGVEALLSENYNDDEVESFIGESLWFASKGGFYTVTDEVLFTVNADKRTVNAVIRHNDGRHKVLSKGRAKCAPGDVFNEHIGKAIALRRVLGLEVPVEYFEVEARDSDDLAAGDVVRGNIDKEYYDILKFIDRPPLEAYTGKIIRSKQYPNCGYLRGDEITLINDPARHTAPDLEVSRIIRH